MADRTHKSILNALVSLFYYFLQMILGFWARKVFYDYLGSEVLGLDTTAYSLLNFLNLAELGIGTSIAFFLYKPLFDDDRLTINEIVTLQGWIYRRIAYLIMGGAAILMCFFPMIFAKSSLPLWCAYATFSVMLLGSLLGYFVNYRQIVLSADQKTYKVTVATQGASFLFKVLLIVLLPVVPFPFLFYLSTTLAGQLFGCFWLNHVLKKEYPWLKSCKASGNELLDKYPDILKKTKQVFIHRISGTILVHFSPLIMYGFASLTMVAYYGNYLVITEKVSSLLGTVFGSTGAGVGNLIASNDKNRIVSVFWELLDSRLCMSWICLLCCYFLIEPLVSVWLGPEYVMSKGILICVILASAIFMNRTTVDSFISGYGLFKDVWATICESILNISLSFGLGFIWGIEGVVAGAIIAQSVFVGLWKPYFLFTQGFGLSPFSYFVKFAGRCLIICASWVMLYSTTTYLELNTIDNYLSFFKYATIIFVESSLVVGILFYLMTDGTKAFVQRMIQLIISKV